MTFRELGWSSSPMFQLEVSDAAPINANGMLVTFRLFARPVDRDPQSATLKTIPSSQGVSEDHGR